MLRHGKLDYSFIIFEEKIKIKISFNPNIIQRIVHYFSLFFGSYISIIINHLFFAVEKIDDFPCALCGKVNASHEKLKQHVKIMHRVFTCEFCAFAAADCSSLLEHKRRSHSVKCSLCDYTATYLGSLYKHRSKVHGLIECDQCFIALPSNEELVTHIKQTHVYVFRCNQCPYAAKLGSYLKNHIKVKRIYLIIVVKITYIDETSRSPVSTLSVDFFT